MFVCTLFHKPISHSFNVQVLSKNPNYNILVMTFFFWFKLYFIISIELIWTMGYVFVVWDMF